MEDQKQAKRARGTGSVYQNGSAVWWIKFYCRGIAHRESSHSTKREIAERLLHRRLAEVETNVYTPSENIRIDELIADLISEYKEKQRRSTHPVERRWQLHLKPAFTRMKATVLTTDQIRRYSNVRRQEGAGPATINRELSLLKRAFNLALESTPPKVKMVPFFPMQTENNVRTGFLRDEDYSNLATECGKEGLWLRALLAVAYNFGWRKGELLALRVRQIDLLNRSIRLDPGTTKNGSGRNVKMTEEVFTLLTACIAGKPQDDYVFTRSDGKPVKSFRRLWVTVCERAGVNLMFHDLRRTGVRNLRRLGVGESVAMKISGHKTASVFRRYDITDDADLVEAARLLDEKQNPHAQNSHAQTLGQGSVTVAPKTGNSQPTPSLVSLLN